MRELHVNEWESISGAPGPLVYLVGAGIAAAGAAVGGYLAGRGSSGNSGTSPLGTVNCPNGTAPHITQTEIGCKPIQN